MLTETQIGFFEDEGYLLVPEVLDTSDLAPVRAEYESALGRAATDLHQRGLLSDIRADLPFEERYVSIVSECPDVYSYLGISLPLSNEPTDAARCRVHTGAELFKLLRHPKVLDVVESIVGPEILSNPVQQARIKPPIGTLQGDIAGYSNVGSTTWHQDFGAVMDDAADTEMLTVWIAITDVPQEMGCLVVIPRSHQRGELTLHCPGVKVEGENYIPAALLEGRPAVPLPGHRRFGHSSLEVDRTRCPRQHVGSASVEFRPPLPAHRPTDREAGVSIMGGPLTQQPGFGATRSQRICPSVARGAEADHRGVEPRPRLRTSSLGRQCRKPHLRLGRLNPS